MGLWAELVVALHAWQLGFKVIAHRYKTKFGEIDLIFESESSFIFDVTTCKFTKQNYYSYNCPRSSVYFIEVKARRDVETGVYCIRNSNKLRIRDAAQIFIASNEYSSNTCFYFIAAIVTHANKLEFIDFSFDLY